MSLQNLATDRSRFSPSVKLATSSELLAVGDRVTVGADDDCVYRIVHISQQKAWVSPLRDGDQRLVRTGELRLLQPMAMSTAMLS